jgi:hypothetical protein
LKPSDLLNHKDEDMQERILNKIGQIALHVADLESAVGFFRDTSGKKFLFQVPGMAFFDCDGVHLLLDEVDDCQHPRSILYYPVEKIQSVYQTLIQKGLPSMKKRTWLPKCQTMNSGWLSSRTLQETS